VCRWFARVSRRRRAQARVEIPVVDLTDPAVAVDGVAAGIEDGSDRFGQRIRTEDLVVFRVENADVFVSARCNADVVVPFRDRDCFDMTCSFLLN
jgi:hypothetical protein